MALKTIRVRIKSVDDALDDAIGVMRAILAKKKVRKQQGEYFEVLRLFARRSQRRDSLSYV